MATFEISDKCVPKDQSVAMEAITDTTISRLNQNYHLGDISLTENGLLVSGNLIGSFERAITEAEVTLVRAGNELHYHVIGTASLGKWPWFWLAVGLFTGFALGVFLFMTLTYLFSKSTPKTCFEDAFNAVKYEYC